MFHEINLGDVRLGSIDSETTYGERISRIEPLGGRERALEHS